MLVAVSATKVTPLMVRVLKPPTFIAPTRVPVVRTSATPATVEVDQPMVAAATEERPGDATSSAASVETGMDRRFIGGRRFPAGEWRHPC